MSTSTNLVVSIYTQHNIQMDENILINQANAFIKYYDRYET